MNHLPINQTPMNQTPKDQTPKEIPQLRKASEIGPSNFFNKETPEVVDQFFAKVKFMSNGCVVWAGKHDANGCGIFYRNGKYVSARRFYWNLWHDDLPKHMKLFRDVAICRERNCVYAGHMVPAENGYYNRIKTHCPENHPYNLEYTRIDNQGRRHCRECDRKDKDK